MSPDRHLTWPEYYKALQATYAELCMKRWRLGDALPAGVLHHTSVPDVAGRLLGTNWAIFSQPSVGSLRAFLEVFGAAVAQPVGGPRRHRYAFLVTNGDALAREDAKEALGAVGAQLDFWTDSISAALNVPRRWAVLDSLCFWFGEHEPAELRTDLFRAESDSSWSNMVASLRPRFEAMANAGGSIVATKVRRLLIDSTFVLDGVIEGVDLEEMERASWSNLGLAALVALERAKGSRLDKAVLDACARIRDRAPPLYRPHRIAPGETLTRIVREQYGCSFASIWPILAAANPKITDVNKLRAGDDILLPKLSE